jgi:hypothetical protein
MRPENEIAPETGGSQVANENENSASISDYATLATLATSVPEGWRDPTDLHLRTLPTIMSAPGHGRHHPRAGCEHLTDVQYDAALNGFVLGDLIFDTYSKPLPLHIRYGLITDAIEMAQEEEQKRPGTMLGFVAYIVAVIDGYAAIAQSTASAKESLQ